MNNITNNYATVNNLKKEMGNLSSTNTRVIFWMGHGSLYKGRDELDHIAFIINERYTRKAEEVDYPNDFDPVFGNKRLVRTNGFIDSYIDSYIAITDEFFREYLCEVNGGMFFSTACWGGDDGGRLAKILFEKGFDCYFGPNGSIGTLYATKIMGAVTDALCQKDDMGSYIEARDALDIAEKQHGKTDLFGISYNLFENPNTEPFRLVPLTRSGDIVDDTTSPDDTTTAPPDDPDPTPPDRPDDTTSSNALPSGISNSTGKTQAKLSVKEAADLINAYFNKNYPDNGLEVFDYEAYTRSNTEVSFMVRTTKNRWANEDTGARIIINLITGDAKMTDAFKNVTEFNVLS